MAQRKSYDDSCRTLQERGFIDDIDVPPLPNQMPSYDDAEPLGVSFLRTGIWDDDLSNLTLPRTYICRCEVSNISFKETDLSESRMCWNDFIEVDFTDADLERCDLRKSRFQNVKFVRSNLSLTDMRQSEYDGCDFSHAKMLGTKLTEIQVEQLDLSPEQLGAIDIQLSDGDEPGGG